MMEIKKNFILTNIKKLVIKALIFNKVVKWIKKIHKALYIIKTILNNYKADSNKSYLNISHDDIQETLKLTDSLLNNELVILEKNAIISKIKFNLAFLLEGYTKINADLHLVGSQVIEPGKIEDIEFTNCIKEYLENEMIDFLGRKKECEKPL